MESRQKPTKNQNPGPSCALNCTRSLLPSSPFDAKKATNMATTNTSAIDHLLMAAAVVFRRLCQVGASGKSVAKVNSPLNTGIKTLNKRMSPATGL